MRKFAIASIVAALLFAAESVGARAAHASDQALMAVLQRSACVPERVVSTRLSADLVMYEVTCKRSARVLQVACSGTDCRLQTPSREDDER